MSSAWPLPSLAGRLIDHFEIEVVFELQKQHQFILQFDYFFTIDGKI